MEDSDDDKPSSSAALGRKDSKQKKQTATTSKKAIAGSSAATAIVKKERKEPQYRNLREEQEALADIETTKNTLRQQKESKEYEKQMIEAELTQLQPELAKLQERDRLKREKAYMEVKVCELRNFHLEAEKAAIIQEQEVLNGQLQRERDALQPLEQDVREIKIQLDQQLKQENRLTQGLSQSIQDIKTCNEKINNFDEEIELVSVELSTIEESIRARRERLAVVLKDKEIQERKLKEVEEQLPRIEKDIVKIDQEIRQCLDSQEHDNLLKQQKVDEVNTISMEAKGLHRQLESLRNPREIFKEKLRKIASLGNGNPMISQTLQAMEWLDNNMEQLKHEGKLRYDVYHPACFYITTSSPVIASMVNKFIPFPKLFGIIALDDRDSTFLKQHFRSNLRLNVNVYTMKNIDPNHPSFMNQRIFSSSYLQSIGLSYLADEIDCPDVIRAYLYSFCSFHMAMYGVSQHELPDDYLTNLANFKPDVKMIQLYMHFPNRPKRFPTQPYGGEILEYVARKSRYGNANTAPSTKVQAVEYFPNSVIKSRNNGGIRRLSTGEIIEDEDVAFERQSNELKRQLDELNARMHRKQQEVSQCQSRITQSQIEQTALSKQKAELRKHLKGPESIRATIQKQQTEIQGLQNLLSAVNVEKDKKDKKRAYDRCINGLFKEIEILLKATEKMSADRCVVTISKRLSAQLKDSYDEKDNALKNARKAVSTLEKQLSDIQKRLIQYDTAIADVEQELQALVSGDILGGEEAFIDGGGYDEMLKLVRPIEEKYLTENFPNLGASGNLGVDVQTPIQVLEGLVELFEDRVRIARAELGQIQDNPLVVQRHALLTEELVTVNQELQALSGDYTSFEADYTTRISTWLTKVDGIVHKIHATINRYMQELDSRGEVKLLQGSSTGVTPSLMDYELQIMVSFRDNSNLSPLTGFLQSGGERAVATIMFLSALQSINSSPFRVVDEINQGMDEINERRVLDRIARACLPDINPIGGDSNEEETNRGRLSVLPAAMARERERGRERGRGSVLTHSEWLQSRHDCLDHFPQYFLVTPKLLPAIISLRDPRVTVMILWNSEGVKAKFSISDLIRTLKSNGGVSSNSQPNGGGSTSNSGNKRRERGRLLDDSDNDDEREGLDDIDEERERDKKVRKIVAQTPKPPLVPIKTTTTSTTVILPNTSGKNVSSNKRSHSETADSAYTEDARTNGSKPSSTATSAVSSSSTAGSSAANKRAKVETAATTHMTVPLTAATTHTTVPLPIPAAVPPKAKSDPNTTITLSKIVVKPEPGLVAARKKALGLTNGAVIDLTFDDDDEEKENDGRDREVKERGRVLSGSSTSSSAGAMIRKNFPIFSSSQPSPSTSSLSQLKTQSNSLVNSRRGSSNNSNSGFVDLTQ